MPLERESFIDPRTIDFWISAIWKKNMASTNSCLTETAPLLTFHFRTRQATTADTHSIANMIKVTLIVTVYFLEKKKHIISEGLRSYFTLINNILYLDS